MGRKDISAAIVNWELEWITLNSKVVVKLREVAKWAECNAKSITKLRNYWVRARFILTRTIDQSWITVWAYEGRVALKQS